MIAFMEKIIVVGATSGIGRGVALAYARRGCKVGITGRRTDKLQELQQQMPDNFVAKPFDITEVAAIEKNMNDLVAQLGGLDLLLISAGVGPRNSDLVPDVEQMIASTNVLGFTAVADWGFNYFKQHGGGHLAGLSSVAGLRGNRFSPAYSASKTYIMNYLQSLRQLANNQKLSIHISDIRPGFVDTVIAQGSGIFWKASVEKAARQIVSALDHKRQLIYITRRWRIIALIIKLIPRPIYERL